MATEGLRVASYARDMTLKMDKFASFDQLLHEAKGGHFDAVVVASPEVLGDTYDELVYNLNKLAEANLLLAVVPSSGR